MMPSTQISREKSVVFTLRALKYGTIVILKPPQIDMKGRGVCVLETEYVPQRDVFTKEIVHNKRYKQVVEEG